MNDISYDYLKEIINNRSNAEKTLIEKAYNYAYLYHYNQYRESGEKYIVHPVNVAYTLAILDADTNSICAGLLHDTIEDTTLTKSEIEENFNVDVANLVYGVTKLSKMQFNSKIDLDNANIRKIVSSITQDVRIIIIKLADRLHNMRTLEYKNKEKQIENAYETLKIFVPLAYYLGAYSIKTELEDLSLKYIKPNEFEKINYDRNILIDESKNMLDYMQDTIRETCINHDINPFFKTDVKNVYGIYQSLEEGNDLFNIYDLFGLKVIVNSIEDCYRSLWLIHEKYRPINEKIRDYIANPKPNLYRSLNTAVFTHDGKIVQARIRTNNLDLVDRNGLIAYYNNIYNKENKTIQQCFEENFKFYDNLNELNTLFSDNKEFIDKVTLDLFSKRVNVYALDGRVYQLPLGSTPIDFAYRLHSYIGNHMIGVQVNGENVNLNYTFNEKDRVRILTDENAEGPNETWLESAHTTTAKRRIKEFLKK